MSDQQPVLTKEGLQKLQAEIEELKSRRGGIALRLQRAKELGDLSENAEYQEAKDEQAFVEGRIMELEELLHSAKIVGSEVRGSTITFGSTVNVRIDSAEKTFVLLGSNEADPAVGKISSDSPLGQALMGKKAGDTVVLSVPRGSLTYTILGVS